MCLDLQVDFPQQSICGDTRGGHGEPHLAEGVPPPPGSTGGPLGPHGLARRFGSMEAQAEVKTEHSATVLRAL
jgi:hypothetical protein